MVTSLITALFVGLVSGYLGSFMVLRRMSLVGDALSHVALPGIALAMLWHVNPFIGAFAALLVGIIVIWFIETHTKLNTEALVGLVFTGALAIGLLITPHEEILDALIGVIGIVSSGDLMLELWLSVLIYLIMRSIQRDLVLSSLSPDLATTSNVKTSRTNFIFLLLVAGIVALGIKVVGTLLMGALVIIPAIAARNMTKSMTGYVSSSTLIGGLSAVGGILVANALHLPVGPIIVLVSCLVFCYSLVHRVVHL